jgi:alanine dehydrogenase
MNRETLLLSASMVSECIEMPEVIAIVEGVFRDHGLGMVAMPPKISLDMRRFGTPNWLNAMPAYVESAKLCGIKWAGGFINNPRDYGLPYVMAILILNDPLSGLPLAVMDAGVITTLRTGAAAAVGAKYLARSNGPLTVTIIGGGAQGRSCLSALSVLFEIREARLVEISKEASSAFLAEMQERYGLRVRPFSGSAEAVAGADVVVTATTSDKPVFPLSAASDGLFVASMGSYPELDPDFVLGASKIVVDSLEQNLHRGELARLVEEGRLGCRGIHAELGDIVAGRASARENPEEQIVACLIGMASEDIAVAARVYQRAQQLGIGQRFVFV